MDSIVVRGAREHNLKNVNLEIPRNRLVVITGVSGSGKSSLAFDTLFAEGQRRYVESLSAYARQFLQQMEKPDVDSIEGLSPAISIEQKSVSQEPALDGGHGHRDPRLPAPALRLDRRAALPELRPADPAADRAADGRPRPGAARGDPARRSTPPTCAARRASTRSSSQQMAREGFLRARIDGEMVELAGELPRARQAEEALDRHRDRPPGGQAGDRASASPTRSRPRSRSAAAWSSLAVEGHARGDPVAELLLRRLRREPDRDHAAALLVQQPLRRLPDLLRARHAAWASTRRRSIARSASARSTPARWRRGREGSQVVAA